MGMFDTIKGNCPWCNEEFYSQTKQFDCMLGTYVIGDHLAFEGKLGLKDQCHRCNRIVVAFFQDGILKSFEKGLADHYEGIFGMLFDTEEEAHHKAKHLRDLVAKARAEE